MKLGLGTVQFGLDYGISNSLGRPSSEEIQSILRLASQSGVSILDTASDYGQSEETLGRLLPKNHGFKIVTKASGSASEIESKFNHSLEKLKTDSVYGLLLHRIEDIENFSTLERLKKKNQVQKIGVSVYNSEQIDLALEKASLDLIQLPLNLLDQRLIQSGHLKKLKSRKIEIHVRSVFLQGLILMNTDQIPTTLRAVRPHLEEIHRQTAEQKASMLELSLGFVSLIPEVDHIIVGVNSSQELQEIIRAIGHSPSPDWIHRFAPRCAYPDETILNPALWRKNA